MISHKTHPVAWTLLMCELDDAHEHLKSLLNKMSADSEYDEVAFGIDLGHIYAHLNRAWNTRNISTELNSDQYAAMSSFPDDLDPLSGIKG